jgi:hypothetical protein
LPSWLRSGFCGRRIRPKNAARAQAPGVAITKD